MDIREWTAISPNAGVGVKSNNTFDTSCHSVLAMQNGRGFLMSSSKWISTTFLRCVDGLKSVVF